jgi:hypothetical protein
VSKTAIEPQNLPERLVWYYILATYPIYLLGAHFVLVPLLATYLTFHLIKTRWSQTEATPSSEKITLSPSVWVWIVAVLVIEVALLVGHINFNLEIGQILKSSFNNWYRKWALFALFPLIGCLNIRSRLIYRAVCILCLQSLFVILVFSLLSVLNIELEYTSPLEIVGGGSAYYQVNIGSILDENEKRLILFAPWAPALGMVGSIYFFLACQEPDKKWRFIGMLGAVSMVVLSVSRLAIMCVPLVLVLLWLMTNFFRPWVQFLVGGISLVAGLFSTMLINSVQAFRDRFHAVRPGSSRVRATLERMALQRWWNDAPIWGHGRLEEEGPAIVAFKPIGTHHTWFGILYIHGLVGCIALAVAVIWSLIDLLIKAQTSELAKVGLSIILVIILFSFSGNIEDRAYLFWPGLIVLGSALKEEAKVYRYV